MIESHPWIEDNDRRRHIEELRNPETEAFYGYQKVSQKEKVHWVRRHFDSVAKQYDLLNTILSFGIHYLWKHNAIRLMDIAPGDRVLDVCGGTGDLAIMAKRKAGDAGPVVIFDINRAMIEAGRAKTTNAGIRRRLLYIQGDAEKISFPDHTFDKAMVGFGIRNVTHYEEGFREMFRVLKPGGVFMCLEFSKPITPWFRLLYDFYSFHIMPLLGQLFAGTRQAYTHLPESIRTFPMPDELADLLRRIGFREVQYRLQTNGISVIHTGKK
jgi:demethylmenaquinone methyltransferase / 2-methoxy-6-polyprenyl-1,4-benzoquinol methylase